MKKNFLIFIFLLILVIIILGCTKNQVLDPIYHSTEEPKAKVQQKSTSIINMTDLEIIKKSSDYLKTHGKNLVFAETRILYENDIDLSSVCKNMVIEDLYYSGDCLVVYFYPHPEMEKQGEILKVYIGKDGKVLGFTAEETDQG